MAGSAKMKTRPDCARIGAGGGYWWKVVNLFNSNVGILLQNMKAHFSDVFRRETAEIQAGIKKLNNYFLSYWIGEITLEVFSVFGLINRTNNFRTTLLCYFICVIHLKCSFFYIG